MSVQEQDLRRPIDFFYNLEKTQADDVFLKQPFGNTWKSLTYAEAGQEARRMAAALRAMDLDKGAHVGIISKNCYHWILADLAIQMAEMVSVPMYATLTAEGLNTVIRLGDVDALFVGKLDAWEKQKAGVPDTVKMIHFPHYPGNSLVEEGESWDKLTGIHPPLEGETEKDWDALWTIIFTSGTTGTPKGVMMSYKKIGYALHTQSIEDDFSVFEIDRPKMFSFLPLNHIAERMVVEMGCLMGGGSISFAESIDSFVQNLKETSPDVFFAVPRIWTKFQQGVLEKMPQKRLDLLLRIPIISSLVKKKIKTGLGLQNTKELITAASITPESLKAWYRKLGLNLREVYGQTENMGGFCCTPKNANKPNSVGQPLAGTEWKIDPTTGELAIKQTWVMEGYYKDPIQTAKVLKDGWLHTGDRVEIDDQNWVKILGRVKDTFKTTKGIYVDPNPIESAFAKNASIDQICVTGLGLPQPIALIRLSDIGLSEPKATVQAIFEADLQAINQTLANHEKVAKIIIVEEEWSVANHILTPTLKIRRAAIHNHYESKMTDWYAQEGRVVWA